MCAKPKDLKEIDSFWDLNSLLPKKRPVIPSYKSTNTSTVEISVDSDKSDTSSYLPPQKCENYPIPKEEDSQLLNRLPLRQRAEEYRSNPLDPYLIYKPDSRLIKHVEISAWNNRFNFYEKFLNDAKRLWSRTAEETEHVPFFSYVPQYSQLSYSQMKWYLWWRENVRKGVYLKSDFCYILLHIYEILNCTEEISPSEGIKTLCALWLNYRKDYRRLDRYMCEWLCDYCLINKLPCPANTLRPILNEIAELSTLKEFYMDFSDSKGLMECMVFSASSYDFKKSRYITEENKDIFKGHICKGAEAAAKKILEDSKYKNLFGADFRVTRTSYASALCAYSAKRSIVVEYTSYARSPKFRFMATDIVKYCENRIRAALGVRSRLKVGEIDNSIKEEIDAYFLSALPGAKKPKNNQNEESFKAYEELYEPISTSFSLESALEIEKKSWDTAELLTDAFTDNFPDEYGESVENSTPLEVQAPEAENSTAQDEAHTEEEDMSGFDEFYCLIKSLDENSRNLLCLLSSGNSKGIFEFSKSVGSLPDALIDKINENAYDIIGDIIIESANEEYRIMSEYEGEITKWLN